MSLINQMLKDLESNRRQSDRESSILTRLQSSPFSQGRRRIHPAWMLLVALLVVVALVVFMPAGRHTKLEKQPATSMPLSKPQAKSKPMLPESNSNNAAVKQAPVASMPKMHAPATEALSLPAHHVMHYVKQEVPLTQAQKISALYQKAQTELDNSNDVAAIAQLRLILQRQPTELHARELLASVLLSDNESSQANDVINVGLKRMPHYAPFTNIKARILMQQGQYAQAIGVLNQASPEIASNPDYYALLAALYQQSSKYMMAAQLYHQLVHVDPANGIWWMGLGVALEAAEKNNAALEAFEHALKGVGLTPATKAYVQQQVDKLS